MTLLQHEALIAAIDQESVAERLVITPLLDRRQIGPASVDLRLGTEFIEIRRLREGLLDPLTEDAAERQSREERIAVPLGDHLVLHPGQFVLGSTLEFLRMPAHLGGQVLGRSSWARLGLIVATAVVVQPGFAGALTLELENMGTVPMRLYPGLRIAQLAVWRLEAATTVPYQPDAKYQAPLGPQSSRLGWESGERDRIQRIGRVLQGVPSTKAERSADTAL